MKFDDQDFSVLRDYTVSREFVDQVRASLPACVVCNKPSGYVDLDGRPSHMVCADESSEERRQAKIESRGGNVARSAGLRDLGAVMRQADEYAVLSPQQRREATLRHIHRNDPPGPRSPELIARMSERSVYDLRDVRVDVFSRDGSSELINRARRAVELGYYPVAGRDQARVMEHVDHLLRRKTSADWQSSELARRILITGSPEYQQIFAKMVIAGLRGMPEASGLTGEEQQLVQRAMAVGTGSAGGFAVPPSNSMERSFRLPT